MFLMFSLQRYIQRTDHNSAKHKVAICKEAISMPIKVKAARSMEAKVQSARIMEENLYLCKKVTTNLLLSSKMKLRYRKVH